MVQSVWDRRQFLAFGLAGLVYPASSFEVRAAWRGGKIFPLRFSGSRTVSSFASGLFFVDDRVPRELRDAIQVELDRTDVRPDSNDVERRRAEFFAWLAVRCIAPRQLRRAGYEALAIECESQNDLKGLGPAGAQQTIGIEHRGLRELPPQTSVAYAASAHASTASFYAGLDEMRWVTETGNYCARALVEVACPEEADPAELAWAWTLAVHAINAAIAFHPNRDERRSG